MILYIFLIINFKFLMEQKIKEIKNNNRINPKKNLMKKSPLLKPKIIKRINNEPKQNKLDGIIIINNNSDSNNKFNKIGFVKKIFNKGNNEPNLINNQLNKYKDIKLQNEKESRNEEDIKEDITDYISMEQMVENKQVTNEAIEEVEEAKEMSELKQSFEINSPLAKESQSIIEQFKPSKNKIIKIEKEGNNLEYKSDSLKNKCTKINLNKKYKKKINISPPNKRSDINFNINKNDIKISNNNKNDGNKLIFKNNNNLTLAPYNIKYIFFNYNISNINKIKEKPKFNKIYINKPIKNNIIISRKKNLDKNKNIEKSRENIKILKTYNNLDNSLKYKNDSKTTTNSKKIFNKKSRIENNNPEKNKSNIDLNFKMKSKLIKKKPLYVNGYCYNKKLKVLNIGSNKRVGKNSKSQFSKNNNINKRINSRKIETKLNKTQESNYNISLSLASLDTIQLRINKLKYFEEKYHKLFEDYYSRTQRNKNREKIKKALIDKSK